MSIKKIAVLSMLAVLLVAFNTPASAQFVGSAGISAASFSSFSASSLGLGFGGFGFPFNVGFVPFGMGAFPFNWRLGGGFGPFPLLGFGGFGSCFSGCGIPAIGAGLGGLAPGIAKASIAQALPFITGSPLGGSPVLGWQVAPWALGTQGCINNLPLYFGAHGFGFPFSLGAWRLSFTPSCGMPCLPACGGFPAAGIPAIGAGLDGLAKGVAKASVNQALPFITGSPLGGSPVLGWQVAPWALGTQGCINNLPLYFGAHGFGFPFSLGAWRLSFTPSCGPCGIPACGPILGGYAPFGAGFGLPAAGAAIAK